MTDTRLPELDDDAVVTATREWLERAVIGLGLCPFAKAVHAKEQIRYCVSRATSARELHVELRSELMFLVGANPSEVETTLLIHPFALEHFMDFNAFLIQVERLLGKLALRGELQVASFHPDYQFAHNASDDMANYSNRSPYPMLHLLREASVERAVQAFPDAAVIYEKNGATLRALGQDGWHQLMASGKASDSETD